MFKGTICLNSQDWWELRGCDSVVQGARLRVSRSGCRVQPKILRVYGVGLDFQGVGFIGARVHVAWGGGESLH